VRKVRGRATSRIGTLNQAQVPGLQDIGVNAVARGIVANLSTPLIIRAERERLGIGGLCVVVLVPREVRRCNVEHASPLDCWQDTPCNGPADGPLVDPKDCRRRAGREHPFRGWFVSAVRCPVLCSLAHNLGSMNVLNRVCKSPLGTRNTNRCKR
jgi:hypothetical protein